MKNKILIIGQAPPANKQSLPYDSTMLYDWFKEIGISAEEALEIFHFDAVYDKFPGHSKNGGHLKPNEKQMDDYWNRELRDKIIKCKSVLVLGACARDYLRDKNINKPIEYIIHPSRRNYSLYQKNKESILSKINALTK